MAVTDKTILYEIDRERAKVGLSPDQLAYVEALEKIANDAYDLWIKLGQANERRCADDLYDSLAQVDFMHDEDESNA
jgi:hypothetical protein